MGYGPDNRYLTFTAQQIVDAISFHLVDLGMATEIELPSQLQTFLRLRLEKPSIQIPCDYWRKLGDEKRLRCLLRKSETAYDLEGTTAVLVHFKWK